MSSATLNAGHPPLIPGLDLQEKVGEGGMSVVYRALHRNLQRLVAVKVLHAATDEGTAGPTWLRESRLMASLAHPHVVAIYDAGQVEGHHYLVMEYLAGGSLRARMTAGRPWPVADAIALLACVAQALTYIHGQKVLHLDLKPENILYTSDGQIKIADFGISTPHADAGALLGGRQFHGTLDYGAPESRHGLALDERYDVFSFATLAYELLAGRVPGRVYVPASQRNHSLPPALDDVLRRGLAREPSDRYGSVAQFQQALADACRPLAAPTPHRSRRRLAVTAALAVLGLSAYFWWPSAARQPTSATSQQPTLQTAERPAALGNGDSSTSGAPVPERPDRLVLLYENLDDLTLFAGLKGGQLTSGSAAKVELAVIGSPRVMPAGLPVPLWPAPRPGLLIHSPSAWGFVYPLEDRSLGRYVVSHWSDLLRTHAPQEKNLIRAGGFDGDCLAKNYGRNIWRVGGNADWNEERKITLGRPPDQPDNPALLLTNMGPAQSKKFLRCFQPYEPAPPPGSTLVLRYRARTVHGRGNLSVHAVMPARVPDEDTGDSAGRLRRFASPAPPDSNDPTAKTWLYSYPAWVMPTEEWQTFIIVAEVPPFPTRDSNRDLIIDLTAVRSTGTDQAWVDDVELFLWHPESTP
jgi:serine/threonine protein kinase